MLTAIKHLRVLLPLAAPLGLGRQVKAPLVAQQHVKAADVKAADVKAADVKASDLNLAHWFLQGRRLRALAVVPFLPEETLPTSTHAHHGNCELFRVLLL